MVGRSSRAQVTARVALVASTTTALAVAAHVAAGGALPAGPLLGTLVLLATAALAPLLRRRLTWARGLAVAAGVEAALHAALTWLAHGPVTTAVGATGGADGAGTPHHGADLAPGALAVTVEALPVHPTASPAMTVAHAAATVVTVGLLVGLDEAVRLVAAWWSHVTLRRPAPVPVVTVRAAGRPVGPVVVGPRVRLLASEVRRRGPPRGVAVTA